MKGVLIILLYLVVGDGISYFIHGIIPGNVIGMVLLFTSLQMKIVNEETIAPVANFLTKNMVILFVPPAVGILETYEIVGQYVLPISIAIVVCTLLVIAIVGKMQDKIGKRDERSN